MEKPDQERIDRYLRKELPPEELKRMEEMIKADSILKREVAAQREAISLAQGMGDQRVKDTIRRAMDRTDENINGKRNGRNLGLVLLVLATLALSVFYFFSKEEEPAAVEEVSIPIAMLYENNYQAAKLTFGNRGSEEVLAAASIAYNNNEYGKALALFEQADLREADAKLTLAKSICHIELAQYEQAQQNLSTALDDPLYGDQCRWYLALLLLRKEDPSAIQQLEILAQSPGGFQQTAARALVEQLKK